MAHYSIDLKPEAIHDLDRLRKYDATKVLDGIEDFLRFQPKMESRSRIKRLRGRTFGDYRLRIDEWRVFYRISGQIVEILRILHKDQTIEFYEEEIR